MVKIEPFHVDHWIASHTLDVAHNLANSYSIPLSVKDLEELPGDESLPLDVMSYVHTKVMDYGTSFNGRPDLCSKIADIYSAGVDPENILTTPGASLANFIVLYALIGPGDHVIVSYPTYQQLQCVPASLGAEVSLWKAKAEDNWRFDTEELKQLIQPNTKMIIVNNPQNPTGAIVPKSTLGEIVKIAAESNIILFGDEIYRPLFHSMSAADQELPPPILSFGYKNTIATSSLSKSYSLAGIRVGWIASHSSSLIELCITARSYCLISTSQIDEHIALFAMNAKRIQKIVERNTALAEQNAATVQAFIDKHSEICSWVKPVGGPIGFIRFTRSGQPIDDYALCTKALEKKGVLLVPGNKCFGDDKDFPGYVRIGFGIEQATLKTGLEALSDFLKEEIDSLPLSP